ncbi:MAG: ATP synthase F0 subunit A [Nitrospirae bacterium GWC2_57_13]|nr:MAG: ATP synthase F0 subunit A [Nitrospirae bacterium GWC1_57_7]OGW26670.1 MAG: ATP synthase F0 subunit A [Nitrospirae bacterium GWC2_57_13]OGW40831.1 MAG: ATP synthase F0 subunit A [Nitrospirae bacterium GWD2_57_8]HAR39715.1 ATP synthase F0 subunit A [Porphyromonadaceae bacterium]HAS54229.1 ATP synthase F0 subunit A [Nitrospiraceae bacterium]
MKEGPLLFNIPDVPAHVTYAVVASGILIGLAIATRLTLKKKDAPTGFQNFMEVLIGGLEDFVVEIMSPEGRHYFTLIAGLFLFILVGNLLGLLPGFDSPTGNLNTTLALALVSFTATHYIGLRRHGIGYVKHFMGPMWALAPIMFIIEVISHLARVLSLSFRLFGNMVAKHKLLLVLALLSPYIAPIPILGLGLLVAVVQAGVFTLLTMLYLSGSIEQAHIGGADHH